MSEVKVVDDRDTIQHLLEKLSESISKEFSTDIIQTENNDELLDLQAKYGLVLWIRGGWKGITLVGKPVYGNSTQLLGFSLWSPNTGVDQIAARFCEIDGVVELLHDGRVTSRDGRPRPKLSDPEDQIQIGKRKFYRLGQLDGASIVERLVQFHESRLGELSSQERVRHLLALYGGDSGPRRRYKRVGADANPIHAKIVDALKRRLEEMGFSDAPYSVRGPDLFMKRAGTTYLFEIKPSYNFHDLTCAMGQLLVYGSEVAADRSFCVCPEGAWPLSRLKNLYEYHGIEVIEFGFGDDEKPTFDAFKLASCLDPSVNEPAK